MESVAKNWLIEIAGPSKFLIGQIEKSVTAQIPAKTVIGAKVFEKTSVHVVVGTKFTMMQDEKLVSAILLGPPVSSHKVNNAFSGKNYILINAIADCFSKVQDKLRFTEVIEPIDIIFPEGTVFFINNKMTTITEDQTSRLG